MEEFKIKYKTNLIIMQEKINLIKQNNNRKLLLFDEIENQKPLIDISSMLWIDESIWENWKKRAHFGTLVGEFSAFEDKEEFNEIVSKIVENKITDSPIKIKDLKLFLNWIIEIYILIDVLSLKILSVSKKIKIHKYESPDFIIEIENNKIIGVEVTFAEDFNTSSWSYRYVRNLNKNSDNFRVKLGGINDKIFKKNLANIEKHFKKKEVYRENICKEFNHNNIDIFYIMPLSGTIMSLGVYSREILQIDEIARNNHVFLSNIIVNIPFSINNLENNINGWVTLEEIINNLESVNKAK